jgi:glycogen debranching enzyme
MTPQSNGADHPPSPTGGFEDFSFRTAEAEPMAIEDIRDALVIRDNGLFLLTDKSGAVPAGNESGFGLYAHDTRFLSEYEFSFSRTAPVMLLSVAARGYAAEHVLTNPAMPTVDGRAIRRETVEVRRVRVIDQGLEETLTVTNFNIEPVTLDFVFRFGADFADIFEVRGQRRRARGRLHRPRVEEGAVVFTYTGLDEVQVETRITFSAPPHFCTPHQTVFRLTLPHRTPVTVVISVDTARHDQPAVKPPRRNMSHVYKEWKDAATRIITSNDLFNTVLDRSIADLRMLWTQEPETGDAFIAAGTPWFDTLFGRDSLITSLETLPLTHTIASASLRILGALQGTTIDTWRDEQPGKILHELRRGEMARTGETPFSRYYGSIDSTALYLVLAGEYWRWTADRRFLKSLDRILAAALQWTRDFGDLDGDGYLEYEREGEDGLLNQGWKDSGDAISAHDGRFARPPIALVEVQAYLYAGLLGLARLAGDQRRRQLAADLLARAKALQSRFNRDFWMEQGGYALALDGAKRQVDSVSSNAGHALWAGIVPRTRARQVVDRLMAPEMFTGWGIRTLSSGEPRYNPLGYHLGTVWPHDNAILAMGFKRYGFEPELNLLATALFEAAQQFDYFRLPELFCGDTRTPQGAPVPYPVACRPQAWSAATIPAILTAILGLSPDAPHGQLYIVKPQLPSWLERVQLRNLRVGTGTVDLLYERRNRRTQVSVLGSTGRIQVSMVNRWPW